MIGEEVYNRVPGGRELIDWFGRVPSFHDGEIVSLELRRRAPSVLAIHAWNTTWDAEKRFVPDKEAVVTFEMNDLIDVQLEGFSHQNVIGGLNLSHGPISEERRRFVDYPSDEDFEIELEPCYGLDGRIRCRSLRIRFSPGPPGDYRPFPTP